MKIVLDDYLERYDSKNIVHRSAHSVGEDKILVKCSGNFENFEVLSLDGKEYDLSNEELVEMMKAAIKRMDKRKNFIQELPSDEYEELVDLYSKDKISDEDVKSAIYWNYVKKWR